jgi:hypothetical protein
MEMWTPQSVLFDLFTIVSGTLPLQPKLYSFGWTQLVAPKAASTTTARKRMQGRYPAAE